MYHPATWAINRSHQIGNISATKALDYKVGIDMICTYMICAWSICLRCGWKLHLPSDHPSNRASNRGAGDEDAQTLPVGCQVDVQGRRSLLPASRLYEEYGPRRNAEVVPARIKKKENMHKNCIVIFLRRESSTPYIPPKPYLYTVQPKREKPMYSCCPPYI